MDIQGYFDDLSDCQLSADMSIQEVEEYHISPFLSHSLVLLRIKWKNSRRSLSLPPSHKSSPSWKRVWRLFLRSKLSLFFLFFLFCRSCWTTLSTARRKWRPTPLPRRSISTLLMYFLSESLIGLGLHELVHEHSSLHWCMKDSFFVLLARNSPPLRTSSLPSTR